MAIGATPKTSWMTVCAHTVFGLSGTPTGNAHDCSTNGVGMYPSDGSHGDKSNELAGTLQVEVKTAICSGVEPAGALLQPEKSIGAWVIGLQPLTQDHTCW